MAVSAPNIQVALQDHVSSLLAVVQATVSRLGFPRQPAADPLVIAVECAAYAMMCGGTDPHDIATKAVRALPPNATEFQRGLTMGLTLCLATEPKSV